MHLGNAFAALLCWLGARSAGGGLVLRIEDIDPERSREEYVRLILEDLRWLGLDWDEGPDVGGGHGPYRQSERLEEYDAVLSSLGSAVYPCYCTRREVREAVGAPQRRNAGPGYPGTCRHLSAPERKAREQEGRSPALRLVFPEAVREFADLVLGPVSLDTAELGGDFPVRRSDGVHAYQLAVVADDIAMGINQVVRGADILDSTPRQLRLYELLGQAAPVYAHVPLLVDEAGRKLSKRHRSLELVRLRERGVRPEAVIGYLAYLGGLVPEMRPCTPAALLEEFAFSRLRGGPLRVDAAVERDLLSSL